jgi:hypothetical protein
MTGVWKSVKGFPRFFEAGGVIKYDSFINEKNEQSCWFFFVSL